MSTSAINKTQNFFSSFFQQYEKSDKYDALQDRLQSILSATTADEVLQNAEDIGAKVLRPMQGINLSFQSLKKGTLVCLQNNAAESVIGLVTRAANSSSSKARIVCFSGISPTVVIEKTISELINLGIIGDLPVGLELKGVIGIEGIIQIAENLNYIFGDCNMGRIIFWGNTGNGSYVMRTFNPADNPFNASGLYATGTPANNPSIAVLLPTNQAAITRRINIYNSLSIPLPATISERQFILNIINTQAVSNAITTEMQNVINIVIDLFDRSASLFSHATALYQYSTITNTFANDPSNPTGFICGCYFGFLRFNNNNPVNANPMTLITSPSQFKRVNNTNQPIVVQNQVAVVQQDIINTDYVNFPALSTNDQQLLVNSVNVNTFLLAGVIKTTKVVGDSAFSAGEITMFNTLLGLIPAPLQAQFLQGYSVVVFPQPQNSNGFYTHQNNTNFQQSQFAFYQNSQLFGGAAIPNPPAILNLTAIDIKAISDLRDEFPINPKPNFKEDENPTLVPKWIGESRTIYYDKI